MTTEKISDDKLPSSGAPIPAMASCRKKKKNEEASFLEDVKVHIDEFIHASMDEHKTCFQKTIKKAFQELERESQQQHPLQMWSL